MHIEDNKPKHKLSKDQILDVYCRVIGVERFQKNGKQFLKHLRHNKVSKVENIDIIPIFHGFADGLCGAVAKSFENFMKIHPAYNSYDREAQEAIYQAYQVGLSIGNDVRGVYDPLYFPLRHKEKTEVVLA